MHDDVQRNDLSAEIAAGDAVRLAELARRYRICISTCFRWILDGLPAGDGSRVHLEGIKRGKCWFTSEAAVKRFFAKLPKSDRHSGGPQLKKHRQGGAA